MLRNVLDKGLEAEPSNPQVYRVSLTKLEQVCLDLLQAIGEDITRPDLRDTPERFARMWQEFIEHEDDNTWTSFENVTTDQMVVVKGIKVWSFCEHHLLPFWCDIAVGYIATDKILGLSKFARIAHLYAHKLQVQEKLVHQIADHVQKATGSEDVAVIAEGEHLCMLMRGAKTQAPMVTSIMRGKFKEWSDTRQEFLRLVGYG